MWKKYKTFILLGGVALVGLYLYKFGIGAKRPGGAGGSTAGGIRISQDMQNPSTTKMYTAARI